MSRIDIKDNYGYEDEYHCRCDNCGESFSSRLLQPIVDAEQRLTPGEETPAGTCPGDECGALAYVVKPENHQ